MYCIVLLACTCVRNTFLLLFSGSFATWCVACDFIASAPVSIVSHIPTFSSDPDAFLNSVLGVDWIDTQLFFLRFINIMREARNSLLVPASFH